MKIQCAPVCFSCHELIFENRCPALNMTEASKVNAWHPGDLNLMFERMVRLYQTEDATNDSQRQLPPLSILSRPDIERNGKPWIVQIDDFLTPTECDTLIELGRRRGYKRSTGLNFTKNADGTYGNVIDDVRTSSNAWCLEECHHNETTERILQRIAYLTNIPDINSEYLQLLHYDVGQFYKVHHDYIDFHRIRAQGVRLATVFLYLNDVEEGGGTNFPRLNMVSSMSLVSYQLPALRHNYSNKFRPFLFVY
jgi:prolyl 4-hydroxylase